MRVLLIRHATAVPSGTAGFEDDDRPLTPRGRTRFRAAARGLARILDAPDVLLTSPLPRARATAEIAARAFGRVEPQDAPVLAHGRLGPILALLAQQAADATVAVVGHEPTLSMLLARLLDSGHSDRLEFKKGGAALVDLAGDPAAGGRLVWFLKPRILRLIGESS